MNRYRILQFLFKAFFAILFRIDVKGLENIPLKGPFILAVNHLSILEPPILFVCLPIERITVLAAEKWRSSIFVGPLLKIVEPIFVNRQRIDRRALRASIKALRRGEILGMAPEGTRSNTGGLIRAKPGIAYLATKARVPILPIGVSGQLGYIQTLRRLKRPLIRVRIGPLVHLSPVTGPDKTTQLQEYADQIMVVMARLIDAELRGVYASAVEAEEASGIVAVGS